MGRRKAATRALVLITLCLAITESLSNAITFPQDNSSSGQRESLILQKEQQLFMREQALKKKEAELANREQMLADRHTLVIADTRKKPQNTFVPEPIPPRVGAAVPAGTALQAEVYTPSSNDLQEFFSGLSNFSLDMLQRLAKSETNVAFSPLTTWVLLSMMSEGAEGVTLRELQTTLALPLDKNSTYRGFEAIRSDIMQIMKGNSLINLGSAAFTSPSIKLEEDFKRIADVCYNTSMESLDFRNTTFAARTINKWVNDLTAGNINGIVYPSDLVNAKLVLTSALYFRGSWKDAFNESLTRREPFMDDSGTRVAEVDMMYQVGRFRLSFIDGLKAIALELPYSSERNSMLLLLPRRGSTLNELLSNMANFSQPLVPTIMKKLAEDEIADTDDEDIHVYLPRFELSTKLQLVDLLKKMGIKGLFTPGRRELKGISSSVDLYVSNMVHKAGINVNEQGTTAHAASAAILHNYSLPSTFKANRPFLFMIIQRATNAILFAGKVGNPAPNTQRRRVSK